MHTVLPRKKCAFWGFRYFSPFRGLSTVIITAIISIEQQTTQCHRYVLLLPEVTVYSRRGHYISKEIEHDVEF